MSSGGWIGSLLSKSIGNSAMAISNPFAELSASVPATFMKTYVVIMALLVVAGTLFDIVHKKSARYFFENWRNSTRKAKQRVGGAHMVVLAVQTAVVDVMASAEFCNQRRRVAHLLTMWGFVIYLVTTVVMVFGYARPGAPTPAALLFFWYIGALLVCAGGCWFWFFIRADVAAEGNSPFRFMQADLFVVFLVLSATFGILWALVQMTGSPGWTYLFLALYLIATTVLFGSIPWSKFSHMFFKPAAALEKRVSEANGTPSNLPPPADLPRIFGSVPKTASHY